MPSHLSHLLIAKKIYHNCELNNIDYNYFLTFSLGADLTKYSKVRKLSHKVKLKELILKMFEYIEKNNLTNDKYYLATIYGHISHIVADKIIHELIYRETRECQNKKIKNHMFLEAYYDAYLLKVWEDKKVNSFSVKEHLQGKVSKVSKMLDYAYYEVYGYKHISRYYKLMLFWYRSLDFLFKIFSLKFLKRIYRYQEFTRDNLFVINEEEYLTLVNKTIKTTINYFNYLKEHNLNELKDLCKITI